MKIDEALEIALAVEPSPSISHDKDVSVVALRLFDLEYIPEKVRELAARCFISLRFDNDQRFFSSRDRKVALGGCALRVP